MSNPRIIVTSPYPEFAVLTKKVCDELLLDPIIIIDALLENAVEKVMDIIRNEDIEVVVSRGGTAAILRDYTKSPVITAEADDFDILKALWQARQISTKIGFLWSPSWNGWEDFYYFEQIIGASIKSYKFYEYRDLELKIHEAKKDGIEVLVTGSQLCNDVARKLNMHGVVIHSSERSIKEALQRAKEVIRIRKHDRDYTQRIKTLMNVVSHAVLLINEKKEIIFINDEAIRLLKLDTNFKSKPNIPILGNTLLNKLLGNGLNCDAELVEELVDLDNLKIVVNQFPVKSPDHDLGYVITFQELSRLQQIEQKTRMKNSHKGLDAKYCFRDIIGNSDIMKKTIQIAKRYGETDATILITGESGTGKELFAQSIHQVSNRKSGPFVAINCAALPENLLESELFGYEEGAFTGAKKGGKIGLFELAHGGTIFLDEIGKISLSLQGRLLRVLQEKEVMHLGGSKVIPVDVRVIAASNICLLQEVKEGRFREDLYYRLNVLQLKLPPLRARNNDVVLLSEHLISLYNRKFGKKLHSLPKEFTTWLKSYHWPGNVRELINYIERLVVLWDDNSDYKDIINSFIFEHHEASVFHNEEDHYISVRKGTLEDMEKQLIKKLLPMEGFNKTKLAKYLGISRNTLLKKLDQSS